MAVAVPAAAATARRTFAARYAAVARANAFPACVSASVFVVCFTIGTLHFLTYHAPAYDFGYFAQVVERTAAGHPFQTSFAPYSFLGQHWEPALLLPAALFRVIATPLWLVGLQSLALALAPLGAWRVGQAWIGGRTAPAAACLATAFSPLLASGAAFDFHTEAVTPALALFALDGEARGRRWRFLLPVAALFFVKEDAMLVAAGVGWIAWRANRRRLGLVVAVAGICAFVLTVGVVMPAFRGGQPSDLAGRYAYLGVTAGAIARGAATHPGSILAHLVGADARIGWLRALGPVAFLPLLSGTALLGALAPLSVALLSDDHWQATLDFQYGLEMLPLLVACALLGWRTVARRGGVRVSALCASALVMASLVAYAQSAYLPGGRSFDAAAVTGLGRRDAVEAVLRTVPPDASVSASRGLVAHLADHVVLHQFPEGIGARFVVLDDTFERGRGSINLPGHGYRLVKSGGGVSLWER